jgi:nicotinate dehydrogenase subunit A
MTNRALHLSVNDRTCTVQADENTPLLFILRNDLDLKGTRLGCGAAQCGSCHVMVDGVSVPSCDTPVWSVEDKQVVTIEGLSHQGVLHPLQQAFIDEQAAQCGFCLSGILVHAAALLEKNPDPSDSDVRKALDEHLCRCGSHNRIVRAVLRAADAMKVAS